MHGPPLGENGDPQACRPIGCCAVRFLGAQGAGRCPGATVPLRVTSCIAGAYPGTGTSVSAGRRPCSPRRRKGSCHSRCRARRPRSPPDLGAKRRAKVELESCPAGAPLPRAGGHPEHPRAAPGAGMARGGRRGKGEEGRSPGAQSPWGGREGGRVWPDPVGRAEAAHRPAFRRGREEREGSGGGGRTSTGRRGPGRRGAEGPGTGEAWVLEGTGRVRVAWSSSEVEKRVEFSGGIPTRRFNASFVSILPRSPPFVCFIIHPPPPTNVAICDRECGEGGARRPVPPPPTVRRVPSSSGSCESQPSGASGRQRCSV